LRRAGRIRPNGQFGLSLYIGDELPDGWMMLWVRPDFYGAQALLAQPRAVSSYAGF
jgi:hypothetical protein